MKIEVYGEKKEEEKVVRLKIFKERSGGVRLCVVDENGDFLPAGFLLEISSSGFLFLAPHVGSDIGLQLDEKGRLKIN